jgi:uncharacterized protein YdhG (YjbR/CyaY superfamily)
MIVLVGGSLFGEADMKRAKSGGRGSSAKGRGAAKSVNEYLARVPEPARTTLKKVRAAIRAAAPPDAIETISYRIPAFKYKGMLAWYAAFSDHCSLFPGASGIAAYADDLKKYSVAKGTIRFPIDKPPPAALIKKLVKARVAENESKRRR